MHLVGSNCFLYCFPRNLLRSTSFLTLGLFAQTISIIIMLITSRRPFYRCNSPSRLPARRSTVAAAAFVDTRSATTIASAPPASSSAPNDSNFRLAPGNAAGVFIAPAPGRNLWIGGCSCDLAPKAVHFDMPKGTTLVSNARMWKVRGQSIMSCS